MTAPGTSHFNAAPSPTPADAALGEVSAAESRRFTDTGKVSEETLDLLAAKRHANVQMSPEELAIDSYFSAEIASRAAKIADEKKLQPETPEEVPVVDTQSAEIENLERSMALLAEAIKRAESAPKIVQNKKKEASSKSELQEMRNNYDALRKQLALLRPEIPPTAEEEIAELEQYTFDLAAKSLDRREVLEQLKQQYLHGATRELRQEARKQLKTLEAIERKEQKKLLALSEIRFAKKTELEKSKEDAEEETGTFEQQPWEKVEAKLRKKENLENEEAAALDEIKEVDEEIADVKDEIHERELKITELEIQDLQDDEEKNKNGSNAQYEDAEIVEDENEEEPGDTSYLKQRFFMRGDGWHDLPIGEKLAFSQKKLSEANLAVIEKEKIMKTERLRSWVPFASQDKYETSLSEVNQAKFDVEYAEQAISIIKDAQAALALPLKDYLATINGWEKSIESLKKSMEEINAKMGTDSSKSERKALQLQFDVQGAQLNHLQAAHDLAVSYKG